MILTQIHKGLLVFPLFIVPSVQAQEYPAADFQPKVVFQDESVVAKKMVEPVSQAPCVSQTSTSSEVSRVEQKTEFDPAYPAANFQPKVIFSDAN